MHKRTLAFTMAYILASVMVFTLCMLCSRTSLVLHSGDAIPSGAANKVTQIAFAQTSAQQLEAVLAFDPALTGQKMTLVISDIRSFALAVNGEEVYRFIGTPATQRTHLISLSEALQQGSPLHIQITGAALKNSIKAAIGSETMIHRIFALSQAFSAFLLGMYLAIVLICLALFIHKKTEGYLLCMVFFTIAVACTDVLYSALPVPRFPMRDTLHMGYLHAVSQTLCLILCLKLMRLEPFSRMQRSYPFILVIFSIAAVLILNQISYILRALFLDLIYLITAGVVIYATAKGKRFSCILLLGTALSGGILLYNSFVNFGYMQPMNMMIFLHMPGVYFMLFDLSCLFVVSNIFAQKFTEAEKLVKVVESSNRELDEKVKERTQELEKSNRRLICEQQKKLAMTTNLFHDLRSPLFCAIGYADIIRSKLPAPADEMNILQRELEYLSHLIENLFLISKLEEKQITFTRQPVDMQKLCACLIEELQPKADQHKTIVTLHAMPGVVIIGDGFRLKQALGNIIGNAIDHTAEGTHVLVLLSKEKEHALLTVEDDGCGIPEGMIDHLFDRYYVRSPDHNRSGLGLPIAQEIIAAHQGDIQVKSTLGQGTCFAIRLPLKAED